jgi:ribokinase
VSAVDTTGAGDAFIGCFAHSYSQTPDVEQAIALAVKYASHSVTGKGTQTSYASGDELAAL